MFVSGVSFLSRLVTWACDRIRVTGTVAVTGSLDVVRWDVLSSVRVSSLSGIRLSRYTFLDISDAKWRM